MPVTSRVKNHFLVFRGNLPCFSFCSLAPVCHWASLKRAWLCPLRSRHWYKQKRSPQPCPLQAEPSQVSLSCPFSIHGPWSDSLLYPCLSSTGEPRTGHSISGVPSPVQNRGEGSPPLTCWWHSFKLNQIISLMICVSLQQLRHSHI